MWSLSCQKRSRKPILKTSRNGYILFSLLIIGTLVMCIAMSVSLGLKGSLKNAGIQRIQGNAFNIAEAGKEHALALLRLDSTALTPNQDSDILTNIAFDIGSYTVRCITNATMDTIVLRSKGIAGAQTAAVEVICHRSSILSLVNFPVKGSVTAKSDVELLGNIVIDGNDYDSTNTRLIPANGVYGVITCGSYTSKNKIRAYGRGIIETSSPYVLDSARKEFADTTGYPRTPEEVLGLPSGSLETFKTASLPSPPFHGIYYLTGPGEIKTPDFTNSSGIVIYHDSTYNSIFRNIHATFKGIIICDKIDKFNGSANILGAVITLSNDPAGNCFGNGNATIHYSSQVLNNLEKYITNVTPSSVDVISWKEL